MTISTGGPSFDTAAPDTLAAPQALTDNRFDALFEAGRNVQLNNQNQLAFAANEQQFALQREQAAINRLIAETNLALQGRKIDLSQTTVSSQANAVNVNNGTILTLQEHLRQLDPNSRDYARQLNTITNSIAAISAATSQVNANITTETSQGHGSLQTAQSGALGANSVTTGQQIDANLATTQINANTQLGLASTASQTQLGLSGQQANVALEQIGAVGATVAEGQKALLTGQGNQFTGIGIGTAAFSNDSNANVNFGLNFSRDNGMGSAFGAGGYGLPLGSPALPMGAGFGGFGGYGGAMGGGFGGPMGGGFGDFGSGSVITAF